MWNDRQLFKRRNGAGSSEKRGVLLKTASVARNTGLHTFVYILWSAIDTFPHIKKESRNGLSRIFNDTRSSTSIVTQFGTTRPESLYHMLENKDHSRANGNDVRAISCSSSFEATLFILFHISKDT